MVGFNLYEHECDLLAVKNYCRENGRVGLYSKDDIFVQQGSVCRYLGFVESGYFKYTTLTSSGDEAVVGFAFEGEIVTDYYNSFHGLSSEVTIIAGADAMVSQIRTGDAKQIFHDYFDGNLSTLNGCLFRDIYSRYLELYRKTPAERYVDLINLHPDIFEIVTLRDIASYLLITPVYLSRIRKKLTSKSGE